MTTEPDRSALVAIAARTSGEIYLDLDAARHQIATMGDPQDAGERELLVWWHRRADMYLRELEMRKAWLTGTAEEL